MYILNTSICNEQNNEVYPQVISMGPDYDWDAENSVTKIASNEPLHIVPNFRSFWLDPATRPTDIVSQGYIYARGLLISDALAHVMEKFSLQPHAVYPAEVVYDGRALQYDWMHMTQELEKSIDFAQSEFCIQRGPENISPVSISSETELRTICKDLVSHISGEVLARKLQFLPNVPSYDLFFIRLTSRTIYISQRLRSCLLQGKYTGFEIAEAETTFPFG